MIENAVWWSEYGCSVEPRTLPEYEFQAHMAILRGKNDEREQRQKDHERETRRARRSTRRR